MSFGIAAATWAAVGAAATVGTALYGIDQQKKGQYQQRLALDQAAAEDARKTAEAETGAQVAANAKLAEVKRRRRSSALALGDPTGTGAALGGQAGPVLAGGAGLAPAARAVGGFSSSGGTALGAGGSASYGVGGGGGSSGRVASMLQ